MLSDYINNKRIDREYFEKLEKGNPEAFETWHLIRQLYREYMKDEEDSILMSLLDDIVKRDEIPTVFRSYSHFGTEIYVLDLLKHILVLLTFKLPGRTKTSQTHKDLRFLLKALQCA